MLRPARAAAAALAALVLVTLPSVAEAHDPIIVGDAQTTPADGPVLPDGTISFALYGVVESTGATRGFRATFADGDRLVVSLLVPDLPPEQTLDTDELPTLRIDAPDGSTRELPPVERVAFDEEFSGTRYLRLLELDEPALAGEYAFTVTGRTPARFTVSIGTTERFGTPAEGVVDRDAGVAGVQAWYDTPPTTATTAPPTTAAPVTAPPTTAAPEVVQTAPPTSGSETLAVDERPSRSGIAIVITVVVGALVIAGAIAVVRRRRP